MFGEEELISQSVFLCWNEALSPKSLNYVFWIAI